MNSDQIKQMLAPLLAMAGGYFVGKGTFTVEQWGSITKFLTENGPVLVGAAISVFAYFKNKNSTKVADIKAMPPAAAAAAVAALPVEAKAAITVAATPDKALIAAVAAMPDVTQVVVKDTATDGVAAAMQDPTMPKVVPQSSTNSPQP